MSHPRTNFKECLGQRECSSRSYCRNRHECLASWQGCVLITREAMHDTCFRRCIVFNVRSDRFMCPDDCVLGMDVLTEEQSL